jgi:hypothetical protein
MRLPEAAAIERGYPPAHLFIHVIGTRPNRWSAFA